MESGVPKCHVDEWICCNNQDQDLRGSCNMVIDKTPPRFFIHTAVYRAVAFFEEETFKYVEANDEVVDEDDADNQPAEGSQARYRFEGDFGDMRAFPLNEGRIGNVNPVYFHRGGLRFGESQGPAKVREEPREGKRLYRENWSKGNQLHENGCLGKEAEKAKD